MFEEAQNEEELEEVGEKKELEKWAAEEAEEDLEKFGCSLETYPMIWLDELGLLLSPPSEGLP